MTHFISFSAEDRSAICAKPREEWLSTCQAMRHAFQNCRPDVPFQAVWLLGAGPMPTKEYWQAVRKRVTRMRMEHREIETDWIAHRREYMRRYMRSKRLKEAQAKDKESEGTVI